MAKYWPEIVNYFGAPYICNLMAGKTAELVGKVIPLNGFPKHDKNLYQTHTIVKKTDGIDYTAELVYIRQVNLCKVIEKLTFDIVACQWAGRRPVVEITNHFQPNGHGYQNILHNSADIALV